VQQTPVAEIEFLPLAQGEQVVDPAIEYEPAVQFWHEEAPMELYLPMGQFWQVPLLAGLNDPAAQSSHNPALLALFPLMQSTHNVVPVTVNFPRLQHVPASLDDDKLAVQFVQEACPTELYVPAAQLLQAATDTEPRLPLYLPSGHPTQVDTDTAAVLLLYLPAAHKSHTLLPSELYLPAIQFKHKV